MARRISKLVVHDWPHWDEAVGVAILRCFGTVKYPGVKDAGIRFWDGGRQTPDGQSADIWEAKGSLALGTWGGRFDDHREECPEDECCTTLVARDLDLMDGGGLNGLIEFTRKVDNNPVMDRFDVSALMKEMNIMVNDRGAHTLHWSLLGIETHILLPIDVVDPKGINFRAILASWLVYQFGADKYPELEINNPTKLAFTLAEFAAKQDKDPVDLVVKQLGIAKNPQLKQLLAYAGQEHNYEDDPFTLETLANHMLCRFEEAPQVAVRWACRALDAHLYGQNLFWQAVSDQRRSKPQVHRIRLEDGKSAQVAVVRSDNPKANLVARTGLSCNADVVVQVRSSGNVQIFLSGQSRGQLGIHLGEVVPVIRVMEQIYRDKLLTKDWDELRQEGSVAGAEVWHYQRQGQFLLNGSLTAPKVPPTRIPVDSIIRALEIGLGQDLHRTCAEFLPNNCRGCAWRNFGLIRCRRARHEARS